MAYLGCFIFMERVDIFRLPQHDLTKSVPETNSRFFNKPINSMLLWGLLIFAQAHIENNQGTPFDNRIVYAYHNGGLSMLLGSRYISYRRINSAWLYFSPDETKYFFSCTLNHPLP